MVQGSSSGHRKAQFTLVAAAILTIALVSLSVMALSASEALAKDDPQGGASWTEVGTQDLLGITEKVCTHSLRPANLSVGDRNPRIKCPAGYTATLYAQGLS